MHGYSFQDLVAIRVVASLLDAGLSLVRIRRAVHYLVESGEDVASLALVTDGDTVWACRDDGEILDALRHGQLALFLAVDRVTADLEAEIRAFDAERQEFVNGLRDSGTVADATDATGATERPTTGEAASGRAGGASVRGGPRPRATPR
jgi:DNA-binding transcriptional MerR regulator